MSEAQARAAADALKGAMGRWGVRCSIELQSGRGTNPWGVYIKYHRMWHHTVSTYRVGGNLTPVLGIVKNGRSDVPGPLANGYIGYDRIFRIICMGEANHPGLGGPITIDGVRIPENSARKPTFGIEVEGGLQTWETIDDLGPDMLEIMGRADNALAEWSSRPLTSQMEHKTWAPERKVDRKDFDAARTRGIALTRKWFALTGEDDMTSDEVTDACAKALRAMTRLIPGVGGTAEADATWAKWVYDSAREQLADEDVTATSIAAAVVAAAPQLAEAIVAELPEGTIDQATVEAGVRAVFADAATP